MDDGGAFPSINYVPIPQGGGNILEGLMQLYGAYKGYKSNQQANSYLAANQPAPGVSNVGALDAWKSVGEGQKTQADVGNLDADSTYRKGLAQYLPNEYADKDLTAGATAEDAAANTARANTDAGDLALKANPQSPENQDALLRTTNEGIYEKGQLADSQLRTSAMIADTNTKSADALTAHKDATNAQLSDHYNKLLEFGENSPYAAKDPAYRADVSNAAKALGYVDPYAGGGADTSAAGKPPLSADAIPQGEGNDMGTPGATAQTFMDKLTNSADPYPEAAAGSLTLPKITVPPGPHGPGLAQRSEQAQLADAAKSYTQQKNMESRYPEYYKTHVPVDARYDKQTLQRIQGYLHNDASGRMIQSGVVR